MKVGIIGLGNMGEQIAAAIKRSGFETYVFDIRAEAVEKLVELGCIGCSSVKELAQEADVIGVVVLNEQQVTDVAEEIAAVGQPRTLVIHSTVTPRYVQRLATTLAPEQVTVLDAPVAGGVARAKTGDLTVMIGGDDEVVQSLRGIFDAIGRDIFHVGPAGAGTAVKLSVNFMTIAGYQLQMEAMELARAYGLTEDALSSVLTTSNADSRGVRVWGFQDRLRRSGAPGTTPSHLVMQKDIASFALAGEQAGLSLPVAQTAAASLIDKVADRDAYLDGRDSAPEIPRCSVCSFELIPPFRDAGTHPECRA